MKIHKIKKKKKNPMLHIWTTKYCISTYSCVKEGQYCERLAARVSGILAPRVDPFLNALTVVFLFVFFNKVFFWTIGCSSYSSLGWSLPPPPPPPSSAPDGSWMGGCCPPLAARVSYLLWGRYDRKGWRPARAESGVSTSPPSSAGPREVKGQLVRVKLLLRLPVVLV